MRAGQGAADAPDLRVAARDPVPPGPDQLPPDRSQAILEAAKQVGPS